jgi:peroxiredoxin
MALTENQDIPLGTACPDFRLPSVEGKPVARDDFRDTPVLVVMFICNHCPYVQAVEDRIIALAREYGPRGVQLVGICSNDPTDYPDDRPERLRQRWQEKRYGFPYLIDETQEVARAFDAVCTPDIYVFGPDRTLAYHGRIDDNWREPEKVKRRELAAALDALVAGKVPSREQLHSIGCSIKWRKARA